MISFLLSFGYRQQIKLLCVLPPPPHPRLFSPSQNAMVVNRQGMPNRINNVLVDINPAIKLLPPGEFRSCVKVEVAVLGFPS